MRILDSEEYISIFSWSNSGKSIVIHQPYELINKVLVKHFDAKEDMKFDSFLRKVRIFICLHTFSVKKSRSYTCVYIFIVAIQMGIFKENCR